MAALDYQQTGYTGANVTLAAATDNTISETFNKADGGLGPNLTWTEQVFTGQPFSFSVVSNAARFSTNQPGGWEDLQVPTPNIETPNTQISFSLTNVTRTGTADYWLSAGMCARLRISDDGTHYQGYACEIGRNNLLFPPAELWSVIIWRVERGPLHGSGDVHLLGAASHPLADVTLPGTLTFTLTGEQLSASFTHAGSGGTLQVAATDTRFTTGGIALGGGNVINGTDSGSVTVDSFTATGDDDVVPADPRGFLWVRNADASSRTVTVAVPGSTFEQPNADSAVVVPAGAERLIGPLTPDLGFGARSLVAVNYSSVTNVSAAAVRVSNPPPDLP